MAKTKKTNDSSTKKVSDDLKRAEEAMVQAQVRLRAVHTEWHRYIQRISFLVILLSLHQAQVPIGACVKDVKSFNTFADSSVELSPFKAVKILFQAPRVVLGLLSILMSFALAYFLQQDPYTPFSDFTFLITNTIAPSIFMMFWTERKNPQASCLSESQLLLAAIEPQQYSLTFPLVLIFYVIVLLVGSFIRKQAANQAKNIQKIRKLQKDLQ